MSTTRTAKHPGRPRVGPVVLLRMPQEMISRIDAAAAELGTTRSEIIRRAVTEWLRRHRRQP